MLKNLPVFYLLLALVLLLAACGQAPEPTPTSLTRPEVNEAGAAGEPLRGVHTYIIVPTASTAAYLVDEEFFEGTRWLNWALKPA